MSTSISNSANSHVNVIDIFTRKPLSECLSNKLIRTAPELDGLEMLYCNSENQDKLFSIKVLAWGLRESGEVVGLVPWLDQLPKGFLALPMAMRNDEENVQKALQGMKFQSTKGKWSWVNDRQKIIAHSGCG